MKKKKTPEDIESWTCRFRVKGHIDYVPDQNEAEGTQFPHSQDALRSIRQDSVRGEKSVQLLARHPDERVRLALAQSSLVDKNAKAGQLYVTPGLLQKEVQEGTQNNEVWTPVLEAVTRGRVWNWIGEGGAYGLDPENGEVPSLMNYVDQKIKPWGKEQDLDVILGFLEKSEALEVVSALVRERDIPNVAVLNEILEMHPSLVFEFSHRKDFSKEQTDFLLEHIVSHAVKLYPREEMSEREVVRMEELTDFICRAFAWLGKRGILFSPEQMERLWKALKQHDQVDLEEYVWWESPVVDLIASQVRFTSDRELTRNFINYLAERKKSSRIGMLIREGEYWIEDVELDIDEELALYILEKAGDLSSVARIMSVRNEVREMPSVRETLMEQKSLDVLLSLMEDEKKEEFRKLFVKLVETARELSSSDDVQGALVVPASSAVTVIQGYPDLAKDCLEVEDVEFLLRSTDRETRVTAITLMGLIRERKSEAQARKSESVGQKR